MSELEGYTSDVADLEGLVTDLSGAIEEDDVLEARSILSKIEQKAKNLLIDMEEIEIPEDVDSEDTEY